VKQAATHRKQSFNVLSPGGIQATRSKVCPSRDVRNRSFIAAGLHAMTALRAGARHVTAVERWLYLSATAHDALTANGFDRRAFDVIYKRPTDLALLRDVPVVCNLLIADIMDEGVGGVFVCGHSPWSLFMYGHSANGHSLCRGTSQCIFGPEVCVGSSLAHFISSGI